MTDTAPAAPAPADAADLPIELLLDIMGEDTGEQPGTRILTTLVRASAVSALTETVEATAAKLRKRLPDLAVTITSADYFDRDGGDPLFCRSHRAFGCMYANSPFVAQPCRQVPTPAAWVEVHAEGLPMFEGGWFVIGVLTRDSVGVVTRHSLQERFESVVRDNVERMGACDHCGRTRSRSTTVLVGNDDTDEVRAIGKSCLTEYTGGALRPDALATLTELGERFQTAFGVALADAPDTAPTVEVVALSVAAQRMFGWVSSSRGTVKTPATAWRIMDALRWDGKGQRPAMLVEDVTDADREAAGKALADVLGADDDTSEYMGNLRAAAATVDTEVTGKRNKIGLLASLPGAAARRVEFLARKAAREAAQADVVNAHIGEAGQRRGFAGTVVRVTGFEGDYGWVDVLVVDTAEGQIIAKGTITNAENYQRGDAITLTATIHARRPHGVDTYQGREMKQTTVQRVKITSIAPVR